MMINRVKHYTETAPIRARLPAVRGLEGGASCSSSVSAPGAPGRWRGGTRAASADVLLFLSAGATHDARGASV